MMRKMRIVPRTDDAFAAPGLLEQLKKLKGFMVADSTSDIRGWCVTSRDGKSLGVVDDVVVETTELEVRYLQVRAECSPNASSDECRILIPARAARIQDMNRRVVIEWLPATGLRGAPLPHGPTPTAAEERAIRAYFAPALRASRDEEEETLDYARFWSSRPGAFGRAPSASSHARQDHTNA